MKCPSMGEDVKTFSFIHRMSSLLHPASASRHPPKLHGAGSDCQRSGDEGDSPSAQVGGDRNSWPCRHRQ